VQAWLDTPANNFGWILIGDETTNGTAKRFNSREHPTPDNRPQLTIAFNLPEQLTVDIDIKFCSNPNGYNCKSKGKTPLTILGTPTFDVNDVDISSLQLCLQDLSACTEAPESWSVFDRGDPTTDLGAAQCAIDPDTGQELDYLNQDGFDDLDVAFDTQEVVTVISCDDLNKRDASPTLVLIGQTVGGTPITSAPIGDVGIDQLLIQKN
jgi:hypothetical protein